MAYADFTLSILSKQFSLLRNETTVLFGDVSPISLDPAFLIRLREDTDLALKVSTEKARSELIISPVLAELRRMAEPKIGLFSGVDFSVDAAKGLVGVCDYIITRSSEQLFVEAPALMLVEAKNEDMKRGYGQCLAEMIAAQTFNEREGKPIDTLYGVVTTGNLWRFLCLRGTQANIDGREYHIDAIE